MVFARYRCGETPNAERSRRNKIAEPGAEKSARRQGTRCSSGSKLTEAEDRWNREAPPRRVEPAPKRRKQTAPAQMPSAQMAKWPLDPDGKRNHKLRHADPLSGRVILGRAPYIAM